VAPFPARLDGRIGDMSPMGMLWTFMGCPRVLDRDRAAAGLVIEGRYQDRELRVTLRLLEPEPLLTSRRFHWINEEPFNGDSSSWLSSFTRS
jgi:hypothetical protein